MVPWLGAPILAASFLALIGPKTIPSTAELNGFAKSRNVTALTALLDRLPTGPSPFQIMRSGGAYGVGRFGWSAIDLPDPTDHREFVVFSTPLTSEDTGELLFEKQVDGLRYVPEDRPFGVRPIRHEFEIRFNIPAKTTHIEDHFTVEAVKNGLGFFRMGPQYRVDSINGKQEFKQAGGVVEFQTKKGRSTMDIVYHATVDLPNYAASISPREATLTNDYWYPMIARWPAPYRITVHVPKGWTAVCQGEVVSRRDQGGETIWKYRMDLPVVFYSLTASPFKAYEAELNRRRFTIWSLDMRPEQEAIQAQYYSSIIDYYDKAFGHFPFSGYGAVVTRSYGGGALEAYSFATYGTGWLPAEDGHEPSHTWWGGIICNTYLHSFWNESFADFSEGMYRRNVPIGNVAERRQAFVSHPSPDNLWDTAPLSQAGADIGPVASVLGYGKGAFVLETLEDEIGHDAMVKAMRHWIDTQPPGVPGEWEDFEKAVDDSAGQDMKWFFDQWVRRAGFPQIGVSDAAFADGMVTMKVDFKGEPYRMAAEVLLQYADGSTEIQRTEIPANANSVLRVPAREKPVLVSFDPYRRMIRAINADEMPMDYQRVWRRAKKYADPRYPSVFSKSADGDISKLPDDLNGTAIIGMPDSGPVVRRLASEAGFVLSSTSLTYKGTTVDLRKNSAVAVIDLGQGKHCVLALGTPKVLPDLGDAYIGLADDLGRFLRGNTLPKLSGRFVFRL